ncbi:SH3 domain-containing protein [Pelagibacterium lacus]|uniref:SH3 domain-containing protein n=1 Tax=Pelagibacterium lacus TaxID=2282655 RepID=UPI001FEA2379|nr:SH3 domain-containing protein [Pelagibacterium lacus]
MKFGKMVAALVLAVAGAFAMVSGAFAYEAAATTALNVRTGPGTSYPVVGALSANQVVNVSECNASGSWCRVEAANIRGWASASYLRALQPTQPTRPAPGQPDVGFSINTPNFSFQIGSGNRPGQPGRGEICFYEGYDYRGRSFCAQDGDQDRYLSNFWNDRIRSARIEGNVSATVCTGGNYSGRCAVIDRSIRNLGMLADNISSYYIGRR